MMLNRRYIVLLICFIGFVRLGNAGKIDKAYTALYQYDYFKAKKYFTKALKYNTAAAAQGLALIFYREDNPFHSYDSALTYVNLAHEKWFITKPKRKDLYAKYGFTEDSISSMRQLISDQYFKLARKENTVSAFSDFIEVHTWSQKRDKAIAIRDSIAFFNAVNLNTSEAYRSYIQSYPESGYKELAQENYHSTLYDEVTGEDKLVSYIEFVNVYPDSPMKKEAERNIYEIITAPNTEEAYYALITKYPGNSYVSQAWKELYQVYLSDYSKERILEFLEKYPDTPIKDRVKEDALMADSLFLPYMEEGDYGYMNSDGVTLVEPKFEFTGFYQEGMAMIAEDGKYGFINKRKEVQVLCQYESVTDFIKGRSIVELNGKFGMIDRNGKYILECEFDDIGMMAEDLTYASVKDKYGYYDNSGKLRIDHIFDEAFDFENGKAKVEFEGNQGYIDIYGGFVVPPAYEKIAPFYDTLYLFEEDGLLGIMNHKCQIFKEPKFLQIGQFSEGLAIAMLDGGSEVVYLDSLGNIVIQNSFVSYPNYLLKGEFHNGIAVVMKEGKYGRIDTSGTFVTPPKYDNIGTGTVYYSFEKGGKWGVMNNASAIVIKPNYTSLRTINNKYVIASKEDTVGMISLDGNIIIPFAFKNIDPLLEGVFIVDDGSGIGLYKNKLKLTDCTYSRIGIYNEDYLYLIEGEELSYFDLKNMRLIGHNKNE